MQALILVGGHGTRLRPITWTIPKPVIPLVDRPFIRYLVDWLGRHDVDEVVMACGFLPDALQEALGDEIPNGPSICYLEEPEPRGTGGGVKFAEDLLEDTFFCLNGDVLADLDLSKLRRRHEQSGARATLGLYPVDDPSAFGLVRRSDDGRITEFLEKPDPTEINTDEISAGCYILNKEVLELMPGGQEVSIERELWPELVGEGLYAERLEGYWIDIGTPEGYHRAFRAILDREVETDPGARIDGDGIYIDADADVGAEVDVRGPVWVQPGAKLEPGASIGPHSVIGTDCTVEGGATVSGSALHDGCRIGEGAIVADSILSARTTVESGANVPEGCVSGEGSTISSGASLGPGAKIQPEETA